MAILLWGLDEPSHLSIYLSIRSEYIPKYMLSPTKKRNVNSRLDHPFFFTCVDTYCLSMYICSGLLS